jgi:hypothetical protein
MLVGRTRADIREEALKPTLAQPSPANLNTLTGMVRIFLGIFASKTHFNPCVVLRRAAHTMSLYEEARAMNTINANTDGHL